MNFDYSQIGILHYASSAPGIGGKIKLLPQDFQVEEICSFNLDPQGDHLLLKITKRNWDTLMLVKQIARKLRITPRRIGFAGMKDKRSISIQYLSIKGISPEQLHGIQIRDLSWEILGRSKSPITPRNLELNRFRVIIRDIPLDPSEIKSRLSLILDQLKSLGGFPNFFGEQRFGTKRPITHLVGRAVLEGDYESAIKLYLTKHFPGESPGAIQARRMLSQSWDLRNALQIFPKYLRYERALIHGLISTGDYRAALSKLPRRLIRLCMHAYQSYLFNLILSARIKSGLLGEILEGDIVVFPNGRLEMVTKDNLESISRHFKLGNAIPTGLVPGRDPVLAKGIQGELELEVIRDQGLDLGKMGSWEVRAGRRRLLIPFQLEYSIVDDPKPELILEFQLPRGAYATALLREILKQE